MSARKSKCVICNDLFPTEDMVVKSSKKYCIECFKVREEEMNDKKNDWDLLFKYICKIYSIDKPTGMMFQQLKQFRGDDYGYTDIGMYYTLKYIYETLQMEVIEGTGLGIIPYHYDRAKRHFNKIFDLKDMVNDFKTTEKALVIKTKRTNKEVQPLKPLPLNIVREEEDDTEDSY